MRERLHSFPNRCLDLWMVWYDYQLDYQVVPPYLELCDVITFWTWNGSELSKIDENFERLREFTPDKRRLAGCYMWNYGEGKPLTLGEMRRQCEKYYKLIRNGQIEGIIFCSNCIADIGLETVEWARNWIREVGDEQV